ncbi:hypothetical protein BTHI11S_00188 [Bosea thiooxidans]
MLNETGLVGPSIRTTNMPGGIGAVAYNNIQAQRASDPNVIVAVSTGSWVNLAQGKFGRFSEFDVRWLGAIGADYGVLAVRKDSRFKMLGEVVEALKKDPTSVKVGAGGTVGSQDWMKPALVLKAAGVLDPRRRRDLAYEGGGEAIGALIGGQYHLFPGDASEVRGQLEAGEVRLLATFSEKRLPGAFAQVPTAKQGLRRAVADRARLLCAAEGVGRVLHLLDGRALQPRRSALAEGPHRARALRIRHGRAALRRLRQEAHGRFPRAGGRGRPRQVT